ncbi:MAG: 23S rRNA (uracil(1939)-C(5))-methyltransferase RlmD [Ruminococcus sp.]|jgi:23S rRNA (uracil1939-C5)-methyltransferase
MQKNDVVRVVIEDMSHKGEGIGKADGYPFFVKDTVIGDELDIIVTKMGKSYGYGRVKEIIKPSPYRVEPRCPYAGPCGGCQLQAMDYDRQLKFKEDLVRNNMRRIGGFTDIPMEPIVGMEEPFHYRNKAQFPVGKDKEGNIITGFYAGRTHRIINNRNCCLGVPVNEEILNRVITYMEENHVEPYNEKTGEGIVRHILIRYGFATGEIMVCLIINAKQLPMKECLLEKLTSLEGMTSISININRKNTNVIMGDIVKTLWGQPYITDYIGDIKYQISPLSFYQVNPLQTKKLYELALSYAGLTGKETVWDLYCGIGTISLFMAHKARKVYGVEIVPAAIEDARRNAEINGIENAEFFVGKAEEVLPRKYREEGIYADVIVVDPPRKGCDEKLLETMVQMAPEKIVYVSCDSATLARDLKFLCGNGYKMDKIRPVDQFGMTVHTEVVALLSKLSAK